MSDTEMDGLTFDPDQDLEQKRSIRQNYRKLASKIEEYQGNPSGLAVDELREQLERADRLFEKVKGPSEATLDSHFLLMASNVGAQQARAMKSGTGSFDVDEYMTKLRNFMAGGLKPENIPAEDEESEYDPQGTRLDWDRIGRLALAKSRRAPALTFMLGPLSIEQKVRNVGKRARLEKEKAPEARPEQLREEDIQQSANETTKNVQVLKAILEQMEEERINLFRFVINPNDFAQSVENIFYLSFLIRDGNVALEIEEGEPLIYLCDPPTDDDYAQGLKKQQLVLEFDQETWHEAIQVFKITRSMIPQRPREGGSIGGSGWYG